MQKKKKNHCLLKMSCEVASLKKEMDQNCSSQEHYLVKKSQNT
jgi:hypothetical protein